MLASAHALAGVLVFAVAFIAAIYAIVVTLLPAHRRIADALHGRTSIPQPPEAPVADPHATLHSLRAVDGAGRAPTDREAA